MELCQAGAKLGLLCQALSAILLRQKNRKCLERNAAGVAQLVERQLPKTKSPVGYRQRALFFRLLGTPVPSQRQPEMGSVGTTADTIEPGLSLPSE